MHEIIKDKIYNYLTSEGVWTKDEIKILKIDSIQNDFYKTEYLLKVDENNRTIKHAKFKIVNSHVSEFIDVNCYKYPLGEQSGNHNNSVIKDYNNIKE